VRFGLRPEHIGLAAHGAALAVPATLRFAEHMGNEVFVHAEIGALPVTARVPSADAPDLQARPRGSPLTLHLQMGAAHLFDPATGASLA
jgi:ABC-type sugar transport system ATPase subunit